MILFPFLILVDVGLTIFEVALYNTAGHYWWQLAAAAFCAVCGVVVAGIWLKTWMAVRV